LAVIPNIWQTRIASTRLRDGRLFAKPLEKRAFAILARFMLSILCPNGHDGRFRHRSKTMQSAKPNLIARDDTFFGVCQGLSEDFGFNPLYLRIVFAVLVLVNPLAALCGYVGAGLLVLISRLVFPAPRLAEARPHGATVEPQLAPQRENMPNDNNAEPEALPVAA
jgi:phage shock protein C